jgi:radical SAM protein with 4Fe4S-binding SPASM domain
MYRLEAHGGPAQRRRAPAPEKSSFCFAGRTTVYVAPDLKVYPCTAFPIECGDLNQQSLRAIWEQSPQLHTVRGATRADTGICGTCAARAHCSYCPGTAYIESQGDWSRPPQLICNDAFAKLEAEERFLAGKKARPHRSQKPRTHFPILNNLKAEAPQPENSNLRA